MVAADTEQPSCRVAIVDDHPLVVDALARHLACVASTEIVFTGDDTDLLLARWPEPTVVLLDLDLGSRTASAELVSEFIQRGARVLIVSAASDLQLVRELLTAGANGVVSKAEPLDVVLEALTTVSRGEDWTSSLVMAAIAGAPELAFPALSPQEQRVIVLYSSGMKISAVARRLDISPHTVKDYLKRIRSKFIAVGRHAPSQVHLYQEALRLGFLEEK